MSVNAWSRHCAFSRGTIYLALGFGVETLRKQVLAILQVNDRDVNPFVGRSGPYASRLLCVKDQFPLREWRMAYAWEVHILKRHSSVFIRKFATINFLMLVEPTFQPI